jgi:hypothetical protein
MLRSSVAAWPNWSDKDPFGPIRSLRYPVIRVCHLASLAEIVDGIGVKAGDKGLVAAQIRLPVIGMAARAFGVGGFGDGGCGWILMRGMT